MKTLIFIIVGVVLCIFIQFMLAFGGQTFVIKQGTTTYGPLSVSKFNKVTNINLDRSLWTDPNIKLTATIEVSANKGSTWTLACVIKAEGSTDTKIKATPVNLNCPLPTKTSADTVRAIATVTGGDIVMPRVPGVSVK